MAAKSFRSKRVISQSCKILPSAWSDCFQWVAQNQFANALTTLASSVDIPIDVVICPLLIELRFGTYLEVATAKDWRALRQLATRFVICGDTLYRRSTDGMLLLCLDRASADQVMREVHAGVCGLHMGGHMLAYFTKYSNGHEFILVAIDYFTKWVEVASYVRLTSAKVASFIRSHIICCYGISHELISDRGVHFRAEVDICCGSMASDFIDLLHISHRPMGQ
ncbi:hypothetical protein CK203_048036 [Vitis vinifera]|uniref:Integrase catalytic domain-containing protein n=1 Tax=Vitis vinifera TaxID=29760 RepID=A0A438GYU6_VITVI|nr:hypothetical protein CK203_048036 [Vitis vinifera]